MGFMLLAGGFVVILIPVVIAVVSSVVSAVAASQDIGEDEQALQSAGQQIRYAGGQGREKETFRCPYFLTTS